MGTSWISRKGWILERGGGRGWPRKGRGYDPPCQLWKYQKFFKLKAQKFNFPKYKKNLFLFPGVDFFYFSSLDWKVPGSISRNIWKAFFWENIWKAFFWWNIRISLILETRKFHLWKYKEFFGGEVFLLFGGIGVGSARFHVWKYKKI